MANNYQVGDLVRVTGTFTDINGNLIDPTSVLFSFKTPAGSITTYVYLTDAQLVKDSTGVYHVDVNANTIGTWPYRFYSTGVGQTAGEASFQVPFSNFA